MANIEGLIIRAERPHDHGAVEAALIAAFTRPERQADEHILVSALRQCRGFVPELSLVAELDGQVVGHILFTEGTVGDKTVLALAPLCVLPAYQRKGIGGALINYGHNAARGLGYDVAVVLGHAEYYPRFGYSPASGFGIGCPFDTDDSHFMAINLKGGDILLSGMMKYASPFGVS